MTTSTTSPTITDEQKVLIAAVRAHALKNYSKGWDIVVEAWGDGDIASCIGGAKKPAGAIAKMGLYVNAHRERREEVESEIF